MQIFDKLRGELCTSEVPTQSLLVKCSRDVSRTSNPKLLVAVSPLMHRAAKTGIRRRTVLPHILNRRNETNYTGSPPLWMSPRFARILKSHLVIICLTRNEGILFLIWLQLPKIHKLSMKAKAFV